MINKLEHLLIILAEECCELAKTAHKSLRFGVDGVIPNTNDTNEDQMRQEYNDILAIVELLNEEHPGMNLQPNLYSILTKKAKVMDYMELSRELGTLEDTE